MTVGEAVQYVAGLDDDQRREVMRRIADELAKLPHDHLIRGLYLLGPGTGSPREIVTAMIEAHRAGSAP